MKQRRSALARRAAAALALASAALAGPALAEGAAAGRGLEPTIERARGEACVAEPAFMRRNHPELLKHQRNETVHQGVRDARASLKGCIDCHASSATGSVAAAKTDFCVSCHSFAAVKVDCFECHASKPRASAFVPLNHPRVGSAEARLVAQWRQIAAQPLPAR
ncbi:MAG: hypothetical protein IPG91_03960 [Ideonella sp.]|nr:hypothetical protein [Ideonella sp.]